MEISFFDAHLDLAKKQIHTKHKFSYNNFLNTEIINRPSKKELRKIVHPQKYFKGRNFETLITNDVNVTVLIEVLKRNRTKNKFNQSEYVKDSLLLCKYTFEENNVFYDFIEYNKEIEDDLIRFTFYTFQQEGTTDKYSFLEDYALKVIKTVKTDIYQEEEEKIEKNIFGYMFNAFKNQGNYFQGIYFLNQLSDSISVPLTNEIGMYKSFVGDNSHLVKNGKLKVKNTNSLNFINAKDHIVEIARDYDFILFNENHQNPYCRYFIRQILPELKREGYINIGIETLSYINHDVNKFGFPVHGSGFFTDEPQMANLVRDAVALGFNVFPYEEYSYNCDDCKSQTDKQQFRETGQANNIIENANSNKTIILAGHGHIYKSNDDPNLKFMAEVLLKKSGKSILSVNQTFQDLYPVPDRKDDCIPLDSLGNYYLSSKIKGKVDIQIVHNSVHHFNNQNDFGRINGNDDLIEVAIKTNGRGYLVVYLKEEIDLFSKRSIPLSVTAFRKEDNIITFKLYKGNYVISEFDEYGVPKNLTKIKI